MERGYNDYLKHDLPFSMFNYLDASRPMVVLPLKYLGQVRSASTSKLSFTSFLNQSNVSEDIAGPLVHDLVIRIVRQDLNKSLNELVDPIQQATDKVFTQVIPQGQDWTTVTGQGLFWPLITHIMARILVGPELWDSEEWHTVTSTYLYVGMLASQHVREKYPRSLRWMAKYVDPYVKAIYATRRKGEDLLRPVVEARIVNAESRGDAYNDAIQWLVDSYRAKNEPVKVEQIMQDVAYLLAASVHGIVLTSLSALFDLIDRPASVDELRHEISQVYAKYGSWNRQSLHALLAMDSFFKESQRVHTPQHYTMQRRALEDFTFKDGLRIPAGTSIFLPSRLLGLDPDVHDNAGEFESSRWKKMREQGDATKNHLASLQDDMLPWGSGPHACPGRFLVQDVMKVIFVHMLTTYDVKYVDGVDCRPADTLEHTNCIPDMAASLMFKRG
ncbi:hypothetical protein ACHAPU_008455 [Fusarium lateritium]